MTLYCSRKVLDSLENVIFFQVLRQVFIFFLCFQTGRISFDANSIFYELCLTLEATNVGLLAFPL